MKDAEKQLLVVKLPGFVVSLARLDPGNTARPVSVCPILEAHERRGAPKAVGLWLREGKTWRRLTTTEAVAFADGRMPWEVT